MEKSEKLDHCLNCEEPLLKDENFCPVCGQENRSQKISIFAFIEEFVSSLFSFEKIFFRTVPAFLFRPGKLTQEFNAGKRKKYINPIRLYLVASLFYFFIIALVIPGDILDRLISGSMNKDLIEQNTTMEEQKNLGSNLENLDYQVPNTNQENYDSASINTTNDSTRISEIAKQSQSEAAEIWRTLRIMSIDSRVSDETFDSAFQATGIITLGLNTSNKRGFMANSNLFISNSIKNLPLMMFFLLPFFAFLLWLLYLKSDFYYIEHLIHGLHLHSFAYFIFGIGILWMAKVQGALGFVAFLCFLVVSIYAYFSLKKISGQGWFLTLVKFFTLGFLYLLILSFALTLELYYSSLML